MLRAIRRRSVVTRKEIQPLVDVMPRRHRAVLMHATGPKRIAIPVTAKMCIWCRHFVIVLFRAFCVLLSTMLRVSDMQSRND